MKKVLFSILALVLALGLAVPMAASVGASPGPGIAGLWHLDEGSGATASDSSGNSNNGTLSGGKFGNALSFDGSGDYIVVNDDDALSPGSAVTLEAWICPKSASLTGYHMVAGKWNDSLREYEIQLWHGKVRFFAYGAGSYTWAESSTTLAVDTWYHVAGVWDGSTLQVYIDGSADGSPVAFAPTGGIPNTTARFTIGGQYWGTSWWRYFDGLIDEVRISNVARTSFNLASPPPKDGNTVALWRLDESVDLTADDETTNDNDGTICGASWAGPTWVGGMFDNALSFDGVDDYVEVPHSTSLDITSQITVEGWIKLASFSQQATVAGKWKDIGGANLRGYLLTVDTSGRPRFYISTTGSDFPKAWAPAALSLNTWYHLAGTYDGTNIKLYVNGTLVATQLQTGAIFSNTEPLLIGANDGWGGLVRKFTNGIIDEVRIWDTATPSFNLYATPETDFNPVGTDHTITATVTITSTDEGEEPAPGVLVDLEVTTGSPNEGETDEGYTDSTGEVELAYTGSNDGMDTITVSIGNDFIPSGSVTVTKYWLENFVTGGGNIKDGKKVMWTFAGTVGPMEDASIVGQFQIVDHNGKEAWHCNNDFSFLEFSGDPIVGPQGPPATHDTANFTGTFNSNRGKQAVLTVTIQDLGEPGKGVDTIEVSAVSDGLTIDPQVIDGGNFQVHNLP